MIGSIIGVGIMNQLLHSATDGVSGVDMGQVLKVAKALFFSPLIGFGLAAAAFLLLKLVMKKRQKNCLLRLKAISHLHFWYVLC
jgi:PiT family inorganic phosphate transporter